MTHFRPNVRDIEFNLFEVLGVDRLLDDGCYGDLDTETVRHIFEEVVRLAEGPLAESYVQADRHPIRFDAASHEVVVTDPLRKSVLALKEAGWWRLGIPEDIGGTLAPMPMVWAVREILHSANLSAAFFNLGPEMAAALWEVGTPEQRRWAAVAMERGWAGTMVLTEPDAGSDVGAGVTKAVEQSDGTWHITGVKRFISGGDVGDTAENIFHLVLARPQGAGPGTKGLSMFFVPKHLFDPATMQITSRNGVYVTGVEHKMGIKSSPTCEITFGGDQPAIGWLVGDVHNGIAQMFKVMENARMGTGVMSTGMLSTGYLSALDYAKTRIQGPDLTRTSDKTAPRVPIIRHPEVRRSLLTQKSYAEGLRALYLFTAVHQDAVPQLARSVSHAEPELAAKINDLLLPVVKAVSSERAYDTLKLSLQMFGGSGYLQDYPMEQYVRDCLINTLYEGTTAIQAQDLLFRKIIRDDGQTLDHVLGLIVKFTESAGGSTFQQERALLATAIEDIRSMVHTLRGHFDAAREEPTEVYRTGLGSVPLLFALGDLVIGWLLLWQAKVANDALLQAHSDQGRQFYNGKITSARFFARTALPGILAIRAAVEAEDYGVMELAEEAF